MNLTKDIGSIRVWATQVEAQAAADGMVMAGTTFSVADALAEQPDWAPGIRAQLGDVAGLVYHVQAVTTVDQIWLGSVAVG